MFVLHFSANLGVYDHQHGRRDVHQVRLQATDADLSFQRLHYFTEYYHNRNHFRYEKQVLLKLNLMAGKKLSHQLPLFRLNRPKSTDRFK